MTEFERLWNALSTAEAPVDTIVVEARRREVLRIRRRRAVVGVAAVAAAFGGGLVVANPPSGIGFGDARPVAFQADLKAAQSCDELLASYRDRGAAIVTAWGWPSPATAVNPEGVVDDLASPPAAEGAATQNIAGADRGQANSRTGTNVQEVGVDEPDSVKTNGSVLVRFREGELLVYDVSGRSVQRLARLRIPAVGADARLLLVGRRVVVIGPGHSGPAQSTQVVSISIEDPAEPKIKDSVRYDGQLLSARQHGATVRLVLASGLPDLDFVQPTGQRSEQGARAENRRIVEKSDIEDWLPQYRSGGDDHRLLDCQDVAVPPSDAGLDTVSIVGLRAGAIDQPHAIALAASTTIAYESTDHLYLASSPATWGCFGPCIAVGMAAGPVWPGGATTGADGTSHLYDFQLDGIDATHVASGEVEGIVADRWSMDEAHGVLRVAVGPSSETGDFNSVVTFRKNGEELMEIGRLDGVGRLEQLHGMRWFDDYAFVVTYRQTDPLFSISLQDPTHPRLIGALKVPGFSDYLHPIGGDRILGVGQADAGGAQIGLFDAHDLGGVTRTDSSVIAGSEALVGADPRTFTWLPDRQTALLVVVRGRSALIDRVHADGMRLSSSLKRVEYGDDAWQVRTMELPDHRVVLVTGEDVTFFPVR